MTTTPDAVSRPSTEPEERPGTDAASSTAGRYQRPLAVALGGMLALVGLRRRRSLSGKVLAVAGGWLLYRGIATERPLPDTVSDRAALRRPVRGGPSDALSIERSITVGLPADELHEYWREPEHLTAIMGEFARVTQADDDRLNWRVEAPVGGSVSWDTEFVEDAPGEILHWRTVEGAPVESEWTVTYRDAPGERGTEVALRAAFDAPGGPVGAAVMGRLGFLLEPVVAMALRRFKSLAETGEVPTLERNPSARGAGDLA